MTSHKKIKCFLIGSCYSGYMFKDKLLGNIANGNIELLYQHQHDSLISIMTNAIHIDLQDVTSSYQWDFNHFAEAIFKKNIFEKLKECQPDYLIFDTWAEVECPLIEINKDTYITSNYYIETASIYEKFRKFNRILPSTKERWELFEKYSYLFFSKLKQLLPHTKIILVQSQGAEEIYEDQCSRKFQSANHIMKLNRLRNKHDQYILNNIDDIRVLVMSDQYHLASKKIKEDYNYSLSSNHYSVEYYKEEYTKLQNIIISDLLGGRSKTRYFNQAICILAQEDFPLLMLQAKIYKDFFQVYIHINPNHVGENGGIFSKEQVQRLREIPNVTVLVKYPIYAGGYNELLALQELSDMALRNKNMNYVHFTSNYDMPIRPINKIYNYYQNSANNQSFLNSHSGGDREAMRRIAASTYGYYYPHYNADEKEEDIRIQIRETIHLQKKLGISRNSIGEFTDLYKGVIWGSLTRDAYHYCMRYIEAHPEYLEDIKFTRLRIEFFFHTILFNTEEFQGKIHSGKRGGKHAWYWDAKKKDYQMIGLKAYDEIKQDKSYLFIRKVTSDNPEVIQQILTDIQSPYKLEL